MASSGTAAKIYEKLENIRDCCSVIPLSPLEEDRLLRELINVDRRLRTRDYTIHSHNTGTFNLVERNRDFFTELQFHSSMGRTWEKVLDGVQLSSHRAILDLCPGYFPKIELALLYKNYRGEVRAINKDGEALEQMNQFLKMFNAPFTFSYTVSDLLDASDKFEPASLLLGNHIIDDIYIDFFGRELGFSSTELYSDQDLLERFWRCILKESTLRRGAVVSYLVEALGALTAERAEVVLVQYPSYIERQLGIQEVSDLHLRTLREIEIALVQDGFVSKTSALESRLDNPAMRFNAEHCLHVVRHKR
ncbi:MAG: hypothetical protein KDD70_00230 [Bdellovibrionales bacterium]|nr:hypothetical protein [Bdellovibrionales bacterium]